MICNDITYTFFRNIERAKLEFCDTINIFLGGNAQGKTSAIEGIYLFARGKSFRCTKDSEMIRFGSEYTNISMNFCDNTRDYSMKIAYSSGGKRVCKRNDIDICRLSEFIGYFRAVLFCPQHLSIIKDGPSHRRVFLDSAISQIKPFYIASLQRYNSILTQRNALIKGYYTNREFFNETIEHWSSLLAREAAIISRERADYIDKLDRYVREFLSDMTSEREKSTLLYDSKKSEEEFFKELTGNLDREVKYGATLYGPHKDDIKIFLNDKEARNYSSQGQQRSIALSMKLAEGEISKENSGEYPVFLFDDILSELDEKRRGYILEGFKGRQIFITACDMNELEKIRNAKRFLVKEGRYTEI